MQPGHASSEAEERAKHLSAIQSLSAQHRLPTAAVADLYERELNRFKQDALITDYLPIFVSRRVSELIRDLKSSTPTPATSDATVQ